MSCVQERGTRNKRLTLGCLPVPALRSPLFRPPDVLSLSPLLHLPPKTLACWGFWHPGVGLLFQISIVPKHWLRVPEQTRKKAGSLALASACYPFFGYFQLFAHCLSAVITIYYLGSLTDQTLDP